MTLTIPIRKFVSALTFQIALITVCEAQQSIDQHRYIVIGGIKQAVWIKGYDTNKPLFLFLHGGPGNSVMGYANRFCDQLYKHFIVVHWDQRDAGETLRLNLSTEPLTLTRFQNDTEQLVDSLLKRFNKARLYIAGHSWGTALGFHLVKVHPSKVEAFIAIGSMVNQQESERIALDLMKIKAIKAGNTQAQAELESIKIPFENAEQLYYHRKYLFEYNGTRVPFSKEFVVSWGQKWLAVFNEASEENLFESLHEVHCPIYFFAGRNDYQTNSSLVEQYFKTVKAPAKEFFWFEKAGHSIPSTFGTQMQKIIIEKILRAR